MKLGSKKITVKNPHGNFTAQRNKNGIPVIESKDYISLMYAQGWIHALDRQLQALLTRIILQGRGAELLAGTDELIEVDRYIRKMNFLPNPEAEIKKLNPHIKERLQAYCDGFNKSIEDNGTVWEMKLLGYKPEPWEIKDCLVIAKTLSFFGQTDTIAQAKKFILQLIQNDIPEKKIKELFPEIKEKIDIKLLKEITLEDTPVPSSIKWLSNLTAFRASNNWVVSSKKTESGNAILCNDPHLEINRLPSVWRETVMKTPDNYYMGVDLSGFPGLVLGRNKSLSWGVTFAYMDMMDFRIEHCKDGMYRRGKKWLPFNVRKETVSIKNQAPLTVTIYENDEGILEGDPTKEGYYLSMCWAAAKDCGAEIFNSCIETDKFTDIKSSVKYFRGMDSNPANWVLADSKGNIGYQMSGRLFKRPEGYSGVLPIPAWDTKLKYRGFVPSTKFPSSYNPPEGYIVTANNNLNHLGKSTVNNICFSSHRADRIASMLKKNKKCTIEDMKAIQMDVYSVQAEKFMSLIRPHLPETENGKILGEWDMKYTGDSCGAILFESIYRSMLEIVFGDNGIGRDAMKYLIAETALVTDFFGNFDSVLLRRKSHWFNGETGETIIKRAIEEGLSVKAEPYENKHSITMSHLLFGGKLPSFMGFDHGPIVIEGSRSTVQQGQIFSSGGRKTSFCPSYRLISDMGTDEIHTNLPGGPTDRRFSKYYKTDIQNWLDGKFKKLSSEE